MADFLKAVKKTSTKPKKKEPMTPKAPKTAPVSSSDKDFDSRLDDITSTDVHHGKEEKQVEHKKDNKPQVQKKQDKKTESKPVEKGYLDKAKEMVDGDREKLYGHPYDNWMDVSLMWSVILGVEVSPQQAVLCMLAMKICREKNMPKDDNMIDIAGYTHVYQKINEKSALENEANDAKVAQLLEMMSKQKKG